MKVTKKIVFGILLLCLAGCASPPVYNITSSTPASIEIDGEIRCQTPCKLTPPHYIDMFGGCHPMQTMQSLLTAYPLDKKEGYVQYKNVRAVCNDNKNIYFDMQASGGVQTIPVAPAAQ